MIGYRDSGSIIIIIIIIIAITAYESPGHSGGSSRFKLE
jgi:hypothetical protein